MVQMRNTAQSYGIVAQAFHWFAAVLIVPQIGLGVYAANLPVSPAQAQWLSHHASLGIVLLAFVLLRFAWRVTNPLPQMAGSMPRWEQRAALATHRTLYVLLVLAPLTDMGVALHHRFWRRDEVMHRMLPWKPKRQDG